MIKDPYSPEATARHSVGETALNQTGGQIDNPVHAPRGAALSCQGWPQEAALRMLMNSLDPDVAERPENLVVCGDDRKAAHDTDSSPPILASLRELSGEETLLVQSGHPVTVFRTSARAPRVVILAADPDAPPDSDDGVAQDLSASVSWIYVGAQSAIPAAHEQFAAAAQKHFGGDLAGRLVVACGLGSVGSAQSLAAMLQGAAFLGIDADPERIKRSLKTGYGDVMVNDLDESLRILKNAVRRREAVSVGLIGDPAALILELAQRGVVPDLLTARALAHESAPPSAVTDDVTRTGLHGDSSTAAFVHGVRELRKLGAVILDSESEVPAPTSTTWVALSGAPADIALLDRLLLDIFPQDDNRRAWIELAKRRIRFQGLPARVCWREADDQPDARTQLARTINDLVASGELKGPVVLAERRHALPAPLANEKASASVGADKLPSGSMNAFLNRNRGASWIAVNQSQDANGGWLTETAAVADGTPETAERIEQWLAGEAAS